MLDRFELDPTKKARAYSKGNRQKVALVAALASEAELLLLDEPTSGLDPFMEAAFTESIREVKAAGTLRPALEPHLRRGGEARRQGDDHPRRCDRRVRNDRRAAPPHPHPGDRRCSTAGPTDSPSLPGVHDFVVVDGRVTFAVDDAAHARGSRRRRRPEPALARGEPALARGALPAPLRRRAGLAGGRGRAMTTTRSGARRARADDDAPGTSRHAGGPRHHGAPRRATQPGASRRLVRRARRDVRLHRLVLPDALPDPGRRSTTTPRCPTPQVSGP